MPEKSKNILKYSHGEKSMITSFIIYASTEFLLEKIDTCHSNPEKSSTTKINILLLVILYLRIVHSMPQKTSMIIIEVKK